MNVGRAITEAMQLDKLRDELRLSCGCPRCQRRQRVGPVRLTPAQRVVVDRLTRER